MSSSFALAVDFGTSNTAAVLREPDGRIRSVLHDGSPVMPSAVCLEPSGRLLVGRDALTGARMYPGAAELHPKRCVDDGEILLGGQRVPIDVAIGAVLGQVAAEARRNAGAGLSRVVLTYPASWGARRKAVLTAAAVRAGLPPPILVPEPLAAAARFVQSRASQVPVGACLLVYDFGAGTFDASVVRRTGGGFDVLGSAGLPDAGGLDVDAAVVANLGATYAGRDPQRWRRLDTPSDVADHRARRLLWDDVRAAKEMLSRASAAVVHVPGLDVDAPIGREQLERLAMPVLDRTVACARATVLDAGVGPGQLGGVLLVGGSSRIPLVGTLLHRAFGVVPTVFEQPELVVAEGALAAADDASPAAPPTVAVLSDVPAPPEVRAATGEPVRAAAAEPEPEPRQDARRRVIMRVRIVVAAALVLVLALAGVVAKVSGLGGDDGSGDGSGRSDGKWAGAGDLVSGSPSPAASATPSAAPSGTARPAGATGTPTGGSNGGGQPGTSPKTAAPPSGPAGSSPTKRCSSYKRVTLSPDSGTGGSAPTFQVRTCIRVTGSTVWVDWDWKQDAPNSVGITYQASLYRCDADVLEVFGQGTSSPGGYTDGTGRSSGVTVGRASSYHAYLNLKSVSVTDGSDTRWTGTTTVRSPCVDDPG